MWGHMGPMGSENPYYHWFVSLCCNYGGRGCAPESDAGVFSTWHSRCENWIVGPSWGTVMRDIRDDLQERASLIEQEIAAAGTDFEKAVEQLQGRLRAELAALGVAMLAEHYKSFLIDSLGGDGRP